MSTEDVDTRALRARVEALRENIALGPPKVEKVEKVEKVRREEPEDLQQLVQKMKHMLDRPNGGGSSVVDILREESKGRDESLPALDTVAEVTRQGRSTPVEAAPARADLFTPAKTVGQSAITSYMPSATILPTTEHDDSTAYEVPTRAVGAAATVTSNHSISSVSQSLGMQQSHHDPVASRSAKSQSDDPIHGSPLRPRLPGQPRDLAGPGARVSSQAVEPQLEDTPGANLGPTARAHIPPPLGDRSLDVNGLAHYVEQLRMLNADYRDRFATFSPPAATTVISANSPQESLVQISAPPPGALGLRAAPTREKVVHLCGSAAGRGVSVTLREGVTEEGNLRALRVKLGIPSGSFIQVTDRAERPLRLDFESMAPEQVCALRVRSSRCKFFKLAGLPDDKFKVFEGHEEHTLQQIRAKLKIPPASVLVLMDARGHEFDLVFEDLVDGEMLLFRVVHQTSYAARTRLKHRQVQDTTPREREDPHSSPSPARRTRDVSPPQARQTPRMDVKPPELLYVTAPGASYQGLSGEYVLAPSLHRDHPQWQSRSGAVLCYSNGGWGVYEDAEAVSGDLPVIIARVPGVHVPGTPANKLPHAIRQWRTAKTGRWAVDPAVEVTATEPTPPGFCASLKSFCCGGP